MMDSTLAHVEGYIGFFSCCKRRGGYSGVATFVRRACRPRASAHGFALPLQSGADDCADLSHAAVQEWAGASLDEEGRCVITDHGAFVLFNVYVPNLPDDSTREERRAYKMRCLRALSERTQSLRSCGQRVIIVGDFNVALGRDDSAFLADVSEDDLDADECRALVRHMASGEHLFDAFRALHPTRARAYTCWNTKTGARALNYGARIDLCLVDRELRAALHACDIHPKVFGSDHCPLSCDLDVELPRFTSPLPHAAENLPEFQGKQTHMLAFFRRRAPGANDIAPTGALSGTTRDSAAHSDRCAPADTPARKRSRTRAPPLTIVAAFRQGAPALPCTSDAVQARGAAERSRGPPASRAAPAATVPERCDTASDRASDGAGFGSGDDSGNGNGSGNGSGASNGDGSGSGASGVAAVWRSLLPGKRTAPLCQGHREPCVLRRSGKPGVNWNREFWVCSRPAGPPGNVAARCNHFQWASEKSTPHK